MSTTNYNKYWHLLCDNTPHNKFIEEMVNIHLDNLFKSVTLNDIKRVYWNIHDNDKLVDIYNAITCNKGELVHDIVSTNGEDGTAKVYYGYSLKVNEDEYIHLMVVINIGEDGTIRMPNKVEDLNTFIPAERTRLRDKYDDNDDIDKEYLLDLLGVINNHNIIEKHWDANKEMMDNVGKFLNEKFKNELSEIDVNDLVAKDVKASVAKKVLAILKYLYLESPESNPIVWLYDDVEFISMDYNTYHTEGLFVINENDGVDEELQPYLQYKNIVIKFFNKTYLDMKKFDKCDGKEFHNWVLSEISATYSSEIKEMMISAIADTFFAI